MRPVRVRQALPARIHDALDASRVIAPAPIHRMTFGTASILRTVS